MRAVPVGHVGDAGHRDCFAMLARPTGLLPEAINTSRRNGSARPRLGLRLQAQVALAQLPHRGAG